MMEILPAFHFFHQKNLLLISKKKATSLILSLQNSVYELIMRVDYSHSFLLLHKNHSLMLTFRHRTLENIPTNVNEIMLIMTI